MQVWSLGQEDPLEYKMATHSSILAWKTPWPEEPGGLQFMVWGTVRHNWARKHQVQCPYFAFPFPLLLYRKITLKVTNLYFKLIRTENFSKMHTLHIWLLPLPLCPQPLPAGTTEDTNNQVLEEMLIRIWILFLSFLVLFFLFLKKVIEMSDIARHSEYMSRRKSVESQWGVVFRCWLIDVNKEYGPFGIDFSPTSGGASQECNTCLTDGC